MVLRRTASSVPAPRRRAGCSGARTKTSTSPATRRAWCPRSRRGFTLWESNTIVRYLSAKHGAGSLWPEDPAERALADKWMDYQLGTLFPAFKDALIGLVRTPPEKRNPEKIEASVRAHGRRICPSWTRTSKTHDYVAGSSLHHGRRRARVARLPLARAGHRQAGPPALQAWHERLAEPPRLPEDRHGLVRDGGPAAAQKA